MATSKKTNTAKKTTEKKTTEVKAEQATIAVTEEAKPEQSAPQKTYSEADVQAMIAKAVAEAMAVKEKETPKNANDGMVTLRFFDEVNDSNLIYLGDNGKYGQIIGKRWTGQVPKMAFIGDFRTPLIQKLLEDRNLIVLDGLTDDERKLYGVNYVEGEFIDDKLYESLLNMPEGDLLEVYRGLCPEWKRLVAVKFAEAYATGKLKVSRNALLALNRESRKADKGGGKGAFRGIIEKMNIAEEMDEE